MTPDFGKAWEYISNETLPAHLIKSMNNKNNEPIRLSRRDFMKAAGIATGAALLAACAPTTAYAPNDENKSSDKEKQIEEIKTASINIITDEASKAKILSSLPSDRPEAKHGDKGIEFFTLTVGDAIIKGVTYELTDEAVANGVIINGTQQNVALYMEVLTAGETNYLERLIGVTTKELDTDGKPTGKTENGWFYDPKGFPTGEANDVSLSIPVIVYNLPNPTTMTFQPLIANDVNIPGYTPGNFLQTDLTHKIPASFKVDAMIINPALEYQRKEKEYLETLTDEQKALYEQYASKDRTSEGLVRRFLEHKGLNTYLAYVDVKPDSKDLNEVVAVWNDETKSTNPALLIGDNVLFINGSTKSDIKFTKAGAEATLEKYFDYARANMIALSKGVNLPNDLDEALADPKAIEFLADGAQVNLRAVKSESYEKHRYNVPAQTILISRATAIVFKTVPEPDSNMFFISKEDMYYGWSLSQKGDGPLIASYFSNGADVIAGNESNMLLSKRISKVMHSLFFRTSNDGSSDTITNTTIFNGGDLSTKPLIIYTK